MIQVMLRPINYPPMQGNAKETPIPAMPVYDPPAARH